jgi:thiamine-phosphate pyrophosphorylase
VRVTKLPRVYPILDSEALVRRGIAVETAAAAFLAGGAGILQLRHKGHWSREIFASAKRIALLCREAGAQFVVNDRADFALLLDAGLDTGLHIGQDDLAPRDARKLMGSERIIGFSSHNAEQLCAAGGEPVDYVALGPIFGTASKLNPDPAVGLEELRRCRALIEKPLVAIGGISLENALEVWQAGADSVAVIAGLLPESGSARGLRERMEQWQKLASPGEA